ncbi:MAG: extracellular solute-binding protein [bacterium]|nr:extracellular solute-binding protein [bacterium]
MLHPIKSPYKHLIWHHIMMFISIIVLFSIQNSAHAQTTPDPIRLRLGMYTNLMYDSPYPDLLLEFTQKTGIEVYLDDYSSGDLYPERVEQLALNGSLNDVFLVAGDYLDTWLGAGYFLPLDGQVDNPDDFYPVALESAMRHNTMYCIPKNVSTIALIYNRDWFDEAGLAYPTNDWTWDDLRANAEALSQFKNAPMGMFLETSAIYWMPLFYQAGGEFSDSNGYWSFNSPQGVESIEFYTSLMAWGGTLYEFTSAWGIEALFKQQVGMTFAGDWLFVAGGWLSTFEPLNWGAVMLPSHTQEATVAFSDCYAVSANTHYPEASIKLANYLSSAYVLEHVFSEGKIPARPSVEDDYVAYWQQAWADLGLIGNADDIRIFPQSLSIARPYPVQQQFLSSFYGAFEENIVLALRGDISAQSVLDRILSALAIKTD